MSSVIPIRAERAHASARRPASLKSWLRWLSWALAVCALLAVLALSWAALTPLPDLSREEVFEIPQGTWARRMSGDAIEILPDEIRLTLGINDVLVLKNLDDVPQIFGPTLMMPGQSFRLPFTTASTYYFACTAHASGQMTIIVDEFPRTPWSRLRWRFAQWNYDRTHLSALKGQSLPSL